MRKIFLIIMGSLSVLLGVIGIFLPLLPTTPLLLLGAYFYMKSSNKLYTQLINHKYLGSYIRNYYEKKGIPLKTKVIVIAMLWLSIGYSVIVIINVLILKILLIIIAVSVTVHILRQNTMKE